MVSSITITVVRLSALGCTTARQRGIVVHLRAPRRRIARRAGAAELTAAGIPAARRRRPVVETFGWKSIGKFH
jgi:hypothetical protein